MTFRAMEFLLLGVTKDIYTLIILFTDAKDIWGYCEDAWKEWKLEQRIDMSGTPTYDQLYADIMKSKHATAYCTYENKMDVWIDSLNTLLILFCLDVKCFNLANVPRVDRMVRQYRGQGINCTRLQVQLVWGRGKGDERRRGELEELRMAGWGGAWTGRGLGGGGRMRRNGVDLDVRNVVGLLHVDKISMMIVMHFDWMFDDGALMHRICSWQKSSLSSADPVYDEASP
ncbi:hypothetical protein Tco_0155957 [Tanacetum coccineum]